MNGLIVKSNNEQSISYGEGMILQIDHFPPPNNPNNYLSKNDLSSVVTVAWKSSRKITLEYLHDLQIVDQV